jgi:hypothetical protein
MSVVHRFYCNRCDRFMYGEDLVELAKAVNYHATAFHPADFANWSATNITASVNYGAPPNQLPAKTLPQYIEPHGTTTKKDSVLPELTFDDKAMLAAGHVRWD